MSKKKVGIIIGVVVVVAAVGVGGFFLKDKLTASGGSSDDKVYVEEVSSVMNQASGIMNRFNGTVESQETYEVKVDSNRKVKEVNVEVGDEVKTGDVLLTYDTDELTSQVKQAKLDMEEMQNDIDNTNKQITTLTTERDQAADEEKFDYTTQIQSLQNTIQQKKYDMEAKQLEIDKLQKQIDESTVVSKVDGVVKTINNSQSDDSGSSDAFMTVMQTGDYRIKGTINEQNVWSLSEGQSVIIRSRVDNSVTWTGTITKIDTENQVQSNNDNYSSDSGSEKATQYPFYVQLDSTDNLILGQHVYIELDEGQQEEKEGLWLYSYYIVQDDGDPYVWADNGKSKLEKRTVELGEYDENLDEYEIVSGLAEDDLIAWPMPGLYEGVKTVTNADEVDYSSPLYNSTEDGTLEDGMGESVDMDGMYSTEMHDESFDMGTDTEMLMPEESTEVSE